MSNQEPEILMPAEGAPREGGEFVAQPAKLLRIASMIRELLEEVRKSSPDEAGRMRLRTIYGKAITALKEGLSDDLQKELETLTIPLEGTPSESEIRLAHPGGALGSAHADARAARRDAASRPAARAGRTRRPRPVPVAPARRRALRRAPVRRARPDSARGSIPREGAA